jgi:hypothetical protein
MEYNDEIIVSRVQSTVSAAYVAANTFKSTNGKRVIHSFLTNKRDMEAYVLARIPFVNGYAWGMKAYVKGGHVQLVNIVNNGGFHKSPVGWMKFNQHVDVPLKWFTEPYVDAMNRIHIDNLGEGNLGYKMWALSKAMIKFRGLLDAMSINRDLHLDVRMTNQWKPVIKTPSPDKQAGFIKPEHAGSGFYTTRFKNSVFAIQIGNVIHSMEGLNKANERYTKIASARGVSIGKRDIFVISDVPAHLADLFVTGAAIVPRSMMEQYGLFRAVTRNGGKFVSYPAPGDMDLDVIIMAKSSWKSGLNGVLACSGVDVNTQVTMPNQVEAILIGLDTDSIQFMGTELKGWVIEDEVVLTNLYTLYGLKTVEEDNDIEDTQTSYYSYAMERLANDPLGYDLVDDLLDHIDGGKVEKRTTYALLKYQDMLNVYFSYGADVHDELLARAMLMNNAMAPKWHRKQQKVFTAGYKDAVLVSADVCKAVINEVWPDSEISVGRIDVTEMGEAAYDLLLNGDDRGWPGLLSRKGIIVTVGSHEFYFPGRDIMKHYITDDGELSFFSGPAQSFFTFALALRNDKTNWAIKHVNHMVDMQSCIMNDVVSRLYVAGKARVALPKFWGEVHEVAMLDTDAVDGHRVLYSKEPVLFDKAMTDVVVNNNMPEYFDGISSQLEFVLGGACFTHTKLLVDQGNDTDGDLVTIRNLGGIVPVYTGQIDYTRVWVDEYAQGEYDLKVKYKPYTSYTTIDLHDSIEHAVVAKGDIGIMSSNLYVVCHSLQVMVAKGALKHGDAQRIKELYAIKLQDEAVRQIKHRNNKGTFFECARYGTNEDMVTAIYSAATLIGGIDYDVVQSYVNGLNKLIWDDKFMERRSSMHKSNAAISYAKCKGRTVMSVINPFMRSYYRNLAKHMPHMAYLNKWADKEASSFTTSFINSNDVVNGFYAYHSYIKKEGLSIGSAVIRTTANVWVAFLSKV